MRGAIAVGARRGGPRRGDARPARKDEAGGGRRVPDSTPAEDVGAPFDDSFFHLPATAFGKTACRLGLASRGEPTIHVEDVHLALGRGVNFLNWPGVEDAVSRAVAGLGPRREEVIVCAQFAA